MSSQPTVFSTDIFILIPAYKAAQDLASFLPHLTQAVPVSQILVVLDGSCAESATLCDTYEIPYLTHEKNRGKGAAIKTGFTELKDRAQWIITMDADGQHAPEDLPAFLHAIEKASLKTGIILGARPRTLKTMPPARIFSNSTTSLALSLFTLQWIPDSQCGYRAYNHSVFANTACRYNHFEMESEILLRAAALERKISSVPIQTIYGNENSHISHIKDTLRWMIAVVTTKLELLGRSKR